MQSSYRKTRNCMTPIKRQFFSDPKKLLWRLQLTPYYWNVLNPYSLFIKIRLQSFRTRARVSEYGFMRRYRGLGYLLRDQMN